MFYVNSFTLEEFLLNFLYRFARATDASYRGYDTTAVLASAAEVAALKAFSPSNSLARKLWEPVTKDTQRDPIYKVRSMLL